MKIRYFITALLAAVSLGACDEHEEMVDLTLKVGNVYRMDGSIVPAEHHRQQMQSAPQPIGVVVAVGGQDDGFSALVVGLHDLEGEYCFSAKTAETDAGRDIKAFDGKENTTTLLTEYQEDKALDPMGAIAAATYSAGGITGWHLPSVGEMMAIVKNRSTIRATLNMLGADDFCDEWYQTSTVDGSSDETAVMYNYCVIMPEGRVWGENKTKPHRVRPFMILR